MQYRPKGVCSQSIDFDIEDNKVKNVSFVGGCSGNLQGISRLIEGMDVNEAISRIGASFLFLWSCLPFYLRCLPTRSFKQ